MNDGVKILLARMDSHPEEFADMFDSPVRRTSSRWQGIMKILEAEGGFLSEEDKTALLDKYHSIQGDNFTQYVMRELLEDTKYPVDMKEIAFLDMKEKELLAKATQHVMRELLEDKKEPKNTARNKLQPPTYKELLAKAHAIGIKNPEA